MAGCPSLGHGSAPWCDSWHSGQVRMWQCSSSRKNPVFSGAINRAPGMVRSLLYSSIGVRSVRLKQKRPAAPLLNATGTPQQEHYPISRAWNRLHWREDRVNGAAHEKPAGNPGCRPSTESHAAGRVHDARAPTKAHKKRPSV